MSEGGFTVDDQARLYDCMIEYSSKRNREGLGSNVKHSVPAGSGLIESSHNSTSSSSSRGSNTSVKQEKLEALKSRVRAASAAENGSWMNDDMINTKALLLMDEKFAHKYELTSANYARNKDISADHINAQRLLTSKFDNHHVEAIFSAPSAASIPCTPTVLTVEELPLYKKISKGDFVMVRYMGSSDYYRAQVVTTIQKGYTSCKYDIRFDGYSSIETVSWQDVSEILNESSRGREDSTALQVLDPALDMFGREVVPKSAQIKEILIDKIAKLEQVALSNLLQSSDSQKRKKSKWDIEPIPDTDSATAKKEHILLPNDFVNPEVLSRKPGGWKKSLST